MDWLEVSVVTDGEGAEAVAEALRPYAYNDGVVLEQLGDMQDLDPNALEETITVKIYIPEKENNPALRRKLEEIVYYLGRLYPLPPPTFRNIAEEDWANAWKAHYQPFRVGRRIWIQPSWLDVPTEAADAGDYFRPDDVLLTLDPGMAFGTGVHPTTQMCLQALEEVITPGVSVLDVGTGSGILAIAAAKLGASRLVGVDTDQIAVETAVANAAQNNVTPIRFQQGVLTSIHEKGWDLVLVNILAPVIRELLERDGLLAYVAPDGYLVLSGIIEAQGEMIETAVAAAGGNVRKRYQVRDWLAYLVGHAASR
jgi:ribosomal protein L11 methyltransferase